MIDLICPLCKKVLEKDNIIVLCSEADTEDVWICINKKCKDYDKIIYTRGDLENC